MSKTETKADKKLAALHRIVFHSLLLVLLGSLEGSAVENVCECRCVGKTYFEVHFRLRLADPRVKGLQAVATCAACRQENSRPLPLCATVPNRLACHAQFFSTANYNMTAKIDADCWKI